MKQKMVTRYSACFKRQFIADLESGRFESIAEASKHYGIAGGSTVNGLGASFADKADAYEAVSQAVWLYNHRRPHQKLANQFPMTVHAAA